MRSNYLKIWRWHFYAGLFVIPFLIMLSLTGIVYLFKPQLDLALYKNLMVVTPGDTAAHVSSDLLLKEALSQHPELRVIRYAPPTGQDRSAEFVLSNTEGQLTSVFLNPYTGEHLGSRADSQYIQAVAKKIHGELMIGKIGDRLVELAACWALILIITGLYLWWPKSESKIWGVWLPRFRADGRTFWKDVHAVTGVYSSIFIALFILSGLPWTGFWGDQFTKAWGAFPTGMFSETPKSSVLNQGATQVVPWAVENAALPKSKVEDHEQHGSHGAIEKSDEKIDEKLLATRIPLQRVVDLAGYERAPAGYTISFPAKANGVFTIAAFTGQPKDDLTIHVDQYSGEKLFEARYKDYGLVPKLVEYGISLHQGQLFGWFNQLICLGICLAILLLCVSGIIMWWKRRPTGSLGAPPSSKNEKIGRTATFIAIVMGVAFPLVGISMIVVWIFDFLFRVVINRVEETN